MSEFRRAYDLLRGYVNREYDRIRGVDLEEAERELNDSIRNPGMPTSTASSNQSYTYEEPLSQEERARRILGVGPEAKFDEIRRAFEKLNKRGDPSRFTEGSVEREHAAAIQKSVQWAYAVLSAKVDNIEKRFRSLEID